MTRGRVVLVSFPFDDLSAAKVRRRQLGRLSPAMQAAANERLRDLFQL